MHPVGAQAAAKEKVMFRNWKTGSAVIALLLAGSSIPAMADVSIGVLIPSSGKGASYGQQQQNADQHVHGEVCRHGGKAGKLKLVIYDTRGENTDAINLSRKLIDSDQVVAIIGPQFSARSRSGVSARGAWRDADDHTDGGEGRHRHRQPAVGVPLRADDRERLPAAARRMAQEASPADQESGHPHGCQGCGIELRRQDRVSRRCSRSTASRFSTPISFQTGDIDYSAQVTRAKALNPDGIVVSALYNEAATPSREIRKQGMKQPIVAGVGVNDPRFIQIGGAATEGVMAASDFFAENPKPAVAAWVADYEKRYNQKPSNASGQMYDTLYLMRECIKSTGVTGDNVKADRVKLRDCWANMKDARCSADGRNQHRQERRWHAHSDRAGGAKGPISLWPSRRQRSPRPQQG